MTDKVFDNNQVSVAGEVISEFTFSHEVFGEGFYLLEVLVGRLSNSFDVIPVMVSERLIDVKGNYKGKFVEVSGQFRSYNRHEDSKNRLVLSVFAREIKVTDEESEGAKPNYIFLDGFVCKPPVYRKTPLGREIADILLAVNRPYGITFHAYAGVEMLDLQKVSKLVDIFRYGAEFKVVSIRRKLVKLILRRE